MGESQKTYTIQIRDCVRYRRSRYVHLDLVYASVRPALLKYEQIYAILLPLRPTTQEHVVDGDLLEANILGDNIITPAERETISTVYLASLVVMNERNNCVPKAVAQFVMNCEAVLEKLCSLDKLQTIYAAAASPGGKRLLKRFEFIKMRDGSQRKDRHDLFKIDYPTLRRNIDRQLRP